MLKARHAVRLVLMILCLSLCSCMETPQEKLVGRWFNSSNTIRFTDEGYARWNSRMGDAQGIYEYDGAIRRTSANEPVRNLSFDLVRAGQSLQSDFELEFLGDDRLRLTPVDGASVEFRRVLVLQRAGEDDEELLIPLAEVVETEPETRGVETYSGN